MAYLLGIIGVSEGIPKQVVSLANQVDNSDLIVHTERDEDLLRVGFEQLSTLVFEWSPSLVPKRLRSALCQMTDAHVGHRNG